MKPEPSHNTVFPLRIASDPGPARGISKKYIQSDTPARLTALRAAGTDSLASPYGMMEYLKSFGVGNTRTLAEIAEVFIK
ncbi:MULTISPECIES: hypothetical protein [unclassified Paenibacillus]|uniref:hypothetical protein n=1 Tax=unclassified Paenibacillus TaxID=185978 RepID=UPI000463FCB0|nr:MULTISPECIES: hypothetical protein [unclassified Paenibacillus]KGP77331.1 hypothetical protein P363_0133620 [Paenibacillus sp. MAEPY1]KGP83990.1 hypothetical protein P364_0106730 [Paenibacillus sp. MAEPY2]